MIAIQFGTYELIKSKLVQYNSKNRIETAISRKTGRERGQGDEDSTAAAAGEEGRRGPPTTGAA